MNRPLAIGCIVVSALLAALAATAVLLGPKLFKKGVAMVNDVMTESARITAFEQSWHPPASSLEGPWMPAEFGSWKARSAQAPISSLPKLDIEQAGLSGEFVSGAEVLELDVFPANNLEKEALLAHADKALEKNGSFRLSRQFGNQHFVTVGGDDRTMLWWLKGWLFVFHTKGPNDLAPTAEAYLQAIDGQPAEPPAAPAP